MSSCKWTSRTTPRILPDRHLEDCAGECAGCEPCTEPHCRVCGKNHAEQTCPACLASTREDLAEIARLCAQVDGPITPRTTGLAAEAAYAGVESDAMVLLAPAADPEGLGHMEASVAVGRVPADYLEKADHDQHPLFVLGTWEMVWRDHFDVPTELQATIQRLVDFLGEHMHAMASEPWVPFEDFAKDLRACRAHLEAVLHDGIREDTGVPCMECRVPLERVWGERQLPDGKLFEIDRRGDGWVCPRCKEFRTEAQYWLSARSAYLDSAEWLPAKECAVVASVSPSSIAVWATRGLVRKKRESGRTLYNVEDVVGRAGDDEVA